MRDLTGLLAGDFAVIDGLEPVTFYRRTGNAKFDQGTQLANAHRNEQRREEVQTDGATLVRTALDWDVWKADFGPDPGAPPKVNDVIRDAAGVRWSVTDVQTFDLGNRYFLKTIREQ